MSAPGRDDRERSQHLMMASLDGEISAEDQQALERLLSGDAALRREFRQLTRVKEVTGTMTMTEPPDEIWDDYWVSIYNQAERGVGWTLVSIGAIVLISFGLWHAVEALIGDADIPGFIKLAIVGVAVGGVILLVSVVRERLFTYRHDPYKGVKR